MAKKIKKRPISQEPVDPNLEAVEEERAFEVEFDEDDNEIIFVHHYRRKWGDGFDADVEHGLNMEEAAELIGVMTNIMEMVKKKLLIEKVMNTPQEGNPLQSNKNTEG